MQLGTRWQSGSTPPASVPEVLISMITKVEDEIGPGVSGAQPSSWTLTWLENRPVCRHDAGVTLRIDGTGRVLRTDDSDAMRSESEQDDSWLS